MACSEMTVSIVAKLHPTVHVVIWFAKLLHYMGVEIDIDRVAELIVKRCMTIRVDR